MIIRGKIFDSDSGAPIAGASVQLTDQDFYPYPAGTTTNQAGEFYLNATGANLEAIFLLVTCIGYKSAVLSTDRISDNQPLIFKLAKNYKDLDPAIVTTKKDKGFLLALLLVALLLIKKR